VREEEGERGSVARRRENGEDEARRREREEVRAMASSKQMQVDVHVHGSDTGKTSVYICISKIE
jgi:hypothetical protein